MTEELWVGRDGTVRDRWTFDPRPVGFPTVVDKEAFKQDHPDMRFREAPHVETTHSSKDFRLQFGLTPSELRHLPSSPTALSRVIRRIVDAQPAPSIGKDVVTVGLQFLLLPAKPDVKGAILDALANLPGLRRLPDEVVGGRLVSAIRVRKVEQANFPRVVLDHVLLLDRQSGQLVGARYVTVHAWGNVTAGTATSRWTWTQRVVDRLGGR